MPTLKSIAPIYCVSDLPATLDWYNTVLGLPTTFVTEDKTYALVGKDNHVIHIQQVTDPEILKVTKNNIEFFLEVDDPDTIYDKAKATTKTQITELKTQPWGNYEFHIKDPDGALLRIGRYA